jgi:protein involved in polysaccharide export with SLBB domain
LRLIFIALISCILLLAQSAVAQEEEYTAKPDDLITVTVWERQTLSGTVKIANNGNITLPMPIGSVKVAGLTATQISDLLTERLKEYMVNPTVFVSISPAEGFTVHVLGEVLSPDFIRVPDGTTVQEVITRAGGFTKLADKNHIQLIRKEKDVDRKEIVLENTIDFSQFIENNDRTANPTLKPNDVLIIPRLPKSERIKYVNVIGAVAKPGIFDLEEPLPLIEVLALAGGPSDIAVLKDISILTVSDDGKYSWAKVDFESFLNGEDETANPNVSPGETVFVPKKQEERFMVNVVGQVVRPGAYVVTDKSQLFDAIYQAGGFVDEAAIDKVTIIHPVREVGIDMEKREGDSLSNGVNPHPQSPVKEQVNVKEYLKSGDEKYNPPLSEGETIFIPMSEGAKKIPSVHTAFFESMRVTIIGEIARPDIYQVSSEVSVLDVLRLAGGPTSSADLERVTILRETPQVAEEQQQLTIDLDKVLMEGQFQLLPKLKADDTIFVPREKPKRKVWNTIVSSARDISTIVVAYLLITGQRKY